MKREPGSIRWVVLLAAIAAGGLALLCLWAAGVSRGELAVLGRAVRSPAFVRPGLTALGCGLALAAVGAVLRRIGRAGRRGRKSGLASDCRGAAMVEFALVFPIALMIILMMVQAMLMMSGAIVVNYAAFAAARTAVVWVPRDLPGDPASYQPEPGNELAPPGQSLKLAKVQAAAANACLPVAGRAAPSAAGDAVRGGVEQYYRQFNVPPPNWVNNYVAGKVAYAWAHTQVHLEPGDEAPNRYGPNEDLTAWVHHEFYMAVPFAGPLFADYRTPDGYVSKITANCTLTNEGVSDVILEDQFN